MKLIDQIRVNVGKRILAARLKNYSHVPVVRNFSDATNIGIIYNATQYISFEVIKDLVKLLSVNQAKVSVLGYVHSKKLIDHYLYRKGFDFFSKNDLNWYYKPNTTVTQKFLTENFDLLIDLSLEDAYPIRYITSLSPATFKVGRYSPEDDSLDFMIDIEKEKRDMKRVQMEIVKDIESSEEGVAIDEDRGPKAENELQLKFLINQLIHYLSLIKK
jgi:hypothetical protein